VAGMPSSISGSACADEVTIQPKIVTGVLSTISGEKSITSATNPSPATAANDAMPSGNLRATNTRLFHVTGSRSQRCTRSIAPRSRRSGGMGIGTPSRPRASARSTAANARHAASVASRIARPTTRIARPMPSDMPTISTMKYASPVGNARTS
jgi:hypothetical protein